MIRIMTDANGVEWECEEVQPADGGIVPRGDETSGEDFIVLSCRRRDVVSSNPRFISAQRHLNLDDAEVQQALLGGRLADK